MDVEKTIRKELRGQEVHIADNNTLAGTVVRHILDKIIEKRKQDKKAANEEFVYEPEQEVTCYCLEETGAKLLNIFLEGADDTIMTQQCLATNISYEDLIRYAKKEGLTTTNLQLTEQEQDILTLIQEHGDDQTLLALRKSFEYLQKEYEKTSKEQVKE